MHKVSCAVLYHLSCPGMSTAAVPLNSPAGPPPPPPPPHTQATPRRRNSLDYYLSSSCMPGPKSLLFGFLHQYGLKRDASRTFTHFHGKRLRNLLNRLIYCNHKFPALTFRSIGTLFFFFTCMLSWALSHFHLSKIKQGLNLPLKKSCTDY